MNRRSDGSLPTAVRLDALNSPQECAEAAIAWVEQNVPEPWQQAAREGGPSNVRTVRTKDEYEQWYPSFGESGLVVPDWDPVHGGLGVSRECARAIASALSPFNLPPLNTLGLNNTAAALFAHGTEAQRCRFLPPIVRNEERWCQLFSEPGAGSDLASLATRAEMVNDEWEITGQKVWTTWAAESEFAIVLARTDPTLPKHRGITYFLIDLRQSGVSIRPLRQMTGEAEFNEVYLDGARVPDNQRLGPLNGGWKVAAATLSSERQMVASGGRRDVSTGESKLGRLIPLAQQHGRLGDPHIRDRLISMWIEEKVHAWTNARVAVQLKAGLAPGPAASIGKVHQTSMNQRKQLLAVDILGMDAVAWSTDDSDGQASAEGPARYLASLPFEVRSMLRSRANSIEGGTTEVNKNVIGERVLGISREPDRWQGHPWNEVPRT
jgi:alkylation response protein AidB-like acyl-CoA dehydrogenase